MRLEITFENDDEKRKRRILAALSNDRLLSIVYAVIYKFQPCTVTEITNRVHEIEMKNYARATIFEKANTLVSFGLVNVRDLFSVSNYNDEASKKIKQKAEALLKKFENNPVMQNKIKTTYFYFIPEKLFEKTAEFLIWACQKHGIKYRVIE